MWFVFIAAQARLMCLKELARLWLSIAQFNHGSRPRASSLTVKNPKRLTYLQASCQPRQLALFQISDISLNSHHGTHPRHLRCQQESQERHRPQMWRSQNPLDNSNHRQPGYHPKRNKRNVPLWIDYQPYGGLVIIPNKVPVFWPTRHLRKALMFLDPLPS